MKRFSIAATVALIVTLFASTVASGQAPPGPSTRYNTRFTEVSAPASSFEIVQQVLEFAPGAAAPFHTHGGPGFVTVIEGELTFRELGKAGVLVKAGETIREVPGQFMDVSNAGPNRARIVAAFLVPAGATVTTFQPGTIAPPIPTKLLGLTRTSVTAPASSFDVVQLILDFSPGVFTAVHKHGGPGQVTVFEGAIVLRRQGTADTTYPAGQGWLELPGLLHSAGNLGSTPASLAVTFLLPAGAPLTTVGSAGPAPAPPATGTGGMGQDPGWPLPLALLSIILMGAGTALALLAGSRR